MKYYPKLGLAEEFLILKQVLPMYTPLDRVTQMPDVYTYHKLKAY